MEFFSDSCLICGKQFSEKKEMARHIKNYHTQKEPPLKDQESSSNDLCADCPFCPFQTEGSSDLEFHVLTCHSEEISSPEKAVKRIPHSSTQGQHSNTSSSLDDLILQCPICDLKSFDSLTLLNEHVELHFMCEASEKETENTTLSSGCSDELMAIRMQKHEDYVQSSQAVEDLYFKQLQDQYGMGELHRNGTYSEQAFKSMEKSVGRRCMSAFDYYDKKFTMLENLELGTDDGLTASQELTRHLKIFIERNIEAHQRVWLCAVTDHIGRGPGDCGWGCGYRNIQMILSCLIKHPTYREKLKGTMGARIPSIPKLQEMIENAWNDGYDPQGKDQLEGKLVGTRKWIGATEAFVLLASLHLHCRIIDFSGYSGPNKSHPLLLEWVCNYFTSPTSTHSTKNITQCEKAPLYLQHDGHSRTIVGIFSENENPPYGKVDYLQFDPAHSKYQIWKSKGKNKRNRMREINEGKTMESELQFNLFLKAASSLGKSQYQIVCVEGIASPQRVRRQKNVNAICEKV